MSFHQIGFIAVGYVVVMGIGIGLQYIIYRICAWRSRTYWKGDPPRGSGSDHTYGSMF